MNKLNGKDICLALRTIRMQVAEANGIDYTPTPCHHQGECSGTCPACEAEARYINSQLGRFRLAGKAVKVAGLALGITMATGNVQQSAACVNARPNVDANGGRANEPDNGVERAKDVAANYTLHAEKADTTDVNGNDSCTYNLPEVDIQSTVSVRRLCYTGGLYSGSRLVKNRQHIYDNPDVVARFKGGDEGMKLFFHRNMRYTPEMNECCAQGIVVVACIVERNGRLTGAHVVRSIVPSFDAEAMRLVKLMPRWKPARIEKKRVRTRVLIKVPFKLE